MKLKTLLFSLVAGIAALISGKAFAFPLTLTSLNGTITSTAYYGSDAASTTNRAKVLAVTLKQILTIVSNEISLQTSGTNAPPANSRIVFDPASNQIYVTNAANAAHKYGFTLPSTNLSISISHITTSFHPVNPNGGSQNGPLLVSLQIAGHGTNNSNYVFGVSGKGNLTYQVRAQTNFATMTISASGSAQGLYTGSDESNGDGVATGNIVFSGSGTPETPGPFLKP